MKAAFEPPSDYVPPSKGGGKNTLWMVLGGGCLVLLLVIGGLFAAGAFKAVSCCNQLQNVASRTMAAQQFATGWGSQLGAGDYQAAYQALTEGEKGRTDMAKFSALFAEHATGMQAAPPQLFNTTAVNHEAITDVSAWRISLQYSTPSAKEMVVVSFDTVLTGEEPVTFGVENIDVDKRPRVLGGEPPAREVLEFHDELQAGRYEMAYGRLPDAFKDATSLDTFRAFLDAEGSILVGTKLEIQEVAYPDPTRATVMAIATGEGRKGVVQYELQGSPMAGMQMWQIMTISPMMQAVTDADELSDMGGDEGDDRVESDASEPSAETP